MGRAIALVTGASSGIGRQVALRLAAGEWDVVLSGRQGAALEETAEAARASGAQAVAVVSDLAEVAAAQSLVARAVGWQDRLDALVNAAGILEPGSLEDCEPEAFERTMAVNVTAPFVLMRAATTALQASGGSIVNVSSVTGPRAFPGVFSYCASKAALDQMTRCAALELAGAGVRVNSVNPGVVVTDLHKRAGMDDDSYQKFLEHSRGTHPLGRVGQPDDVASAVEFLLSAQAGWITGVTLPIDGGRAQTCAR